MDNPKVLTEDWTGVLIQWALFFGLMSIIFFPAFKFRNLARAYNQKGWVYFIVGLGIGFAALNLGHLLIIPLKGFVVKEYQPYFISLLFITGFVVYWFSYKYLRRYFERHHSAD
ncbi:MAG: hypothetical protein QM762_09195 [Chryseolinea sp.]